MPKEKVDYSKTEIYKLIHKDDVDNENIYIGSTTNFRQRKCAHKTNCNNEKVKSYNSKVYTNIRLIGGWSEWSMILVEKFPCIDKRESLVRERYWIDHYKTVLNIQLPCRTQKEYYTHNIEKISEYIKQYGIDNEEQI